jgi:hypothetical protein
MIVPLDVLRHVKEGKVSLFKRKGPTCSYDVGRVYGLQHERKKPPNIHVTITFKEQRESGSLNLREARRLGFRTTADMIAATPRYDPAELIWLLGFEVGDLTDSDRLPAARFGPAGDYVSSAARALSGVGSEVSEATQKRYAAQSEATYAQILSDKRKRALDAIADVQEYATSPRERKRLRAAANQIRALDNVAPDAILDAS